jgi:nucleoid-associated protein YgaU
MKKTIILVAAVLVALVAAGCKQPTGATRTEVIAVERPAEGPVPDLTGETGQTTGAEEMPDPGESQTGQTPAPERTYVVQPKDTLWSIAKKVYGDPKRWKDIAEANNVTNEKTLPVGKVLKIPQ